MGSTIEIADGVWQLTPLPGINCWLIRDEQGVTLVDTALDRTTERLLRLLRKIGVQPSDVTRVLLTHHHPDHAGGAATVIGLAGSPEVAAGRADVPVIEGTEDPEEPMDGGVLARLMASLPDFLQPPQPAPVKNVRPLDDGDVLDGGIEILATPGHTQGHVALVLPAHELVLGGDVVFNIFRLRPSPAFLCWDAQRNVDSILKVADVDPRVLALAHGAPVDRDPAGRLRELVS